MKLRNMSLMFALAAVLVAAAAVAQYSAGVYREQGGNRMVVGSGAELDIESGGAFQVGGVDFASKCTIAVFGTFAIDGDTQHGGIVTGNTTVVATEASAAYCVVEDYGTTSDYQQLATSSTGTGITANYQLWPDTEALGDAVYFGAAIPFCELAIDVSATVATYSSDAVTWKYYDGDSWETLTIAHDYTDSTALDGKRPFQRDGAISFVPPDDWAAGTVNSQVAYWIKAQITGANVTQIPITNSKEHLICTPTDAATIPYDCTITEIRLSEIAGTVHTNVVKFVLWNFTSGTGSGELTVAASQTLDMWTGLTMVCEAGDEVAVVVTDEDGTNEISYAVIELTLEL